MTITNFLVDFFAKKEHFSKKSQLTFALLKTVPSFLFDYGLIWTSFFFNFFLNLFLFSATNLNQTCKNKACLVSKSGAITYWLLVHNVIKQNYLF